LVWATHSVGPDRTDDHLEAQNIHVVSIFKDEEGGR
jgi:hypothetical protein